MKSLKIIFLLTLFISTLSCSAQSAKDVSLISGKIKDGLRTLTVEKGNENLTFTVYRGDYIVFDFKEAGLYEIKIPAMEIETVMPKAETEKPYIKMKNSGEYAFTIGNREGLIKVLEFSEPHYQELTAAQASDLLGNTDPLILDVRTEGEYVTGHIQGANLLPVQIISQNLKQLEQFKNRDILIYCQSGNRSNVAATILIDAGFTNIYNLRNGIGDWIKNDYPVE
jgi:rhodanese-related sulfurtransferase